jgi:hypothetical protein
LQACKFTFWLCGPHLVFAVAEYIMRHTLTKGILNFRRIIFMKEIPSSLSFVTFIGPVLDFFFYNHFSSHLHCLY